jgi:aspartate kinase
MAVMKFGGTSVGTARAMQQAISIVAEERKQGVPLVVLSACSGITNKLIQIAEAAGSGNIEEAAARVEEVRNHHLGLIDELIGAGALKASLKAKVASYINELEMLVKGVDIVGELTGRSKDMFCSFGELLSTTVFAAALGEHGLLTEWLDIRSVMITDDNFGFARPINEICEAGVNGVIRPLLDSGIIVVTQGYIGSNKAGKTTTLGRGGSDLSAALLGAWLHDNAIQIWTDVDGVMTCDISAQRFSIRIPLLLPSRKTFRSMC